MDANTNADMDLGDIELNIMTDNDFTPTTPLRASSIRRKEFGHIRFMLHRIYLSYLLVSISYVIGVTIPIYFTDSYHKLGMILPIISIISLILFGYLIQFIQYHIGSNYKKLVFAISFIHGIVQYAINYYLNIDPIFVLHIIVYISIVHGTILFFINIVKNDNQLFFAFMMSFGIYFWFSLCLLETYEEFKLTRIINLSITIGTFQLYELINLYYIIEDLHNNNFHKSSYVDLILWNGITVICHLIEDIAKIQSPTKKKKLD
jgi:hypothetical protein